MMERRGFTRLNYIVMSCLVCALPSFAETIWLSELDLSKMKTGYGQAQANQSITKNPLMIASQRFEKGVGSHADSIFYINLNGGSTRFSARVGVDDQAQSKGSVTFRIYGDGKLLFDSGIRKGGQPDKSAEVSTIGISTLVLAVTSAGDGIEFDHADWADARFEVTGSKPQAIDPPVQKKEIWTPAPGTAPRLNNPCVFGSQPGNPFIYRIPATGKRPMRFDAEKLPESLKLDPVTGIITGNSPQKHGEYPILLKAQNANGQDQREFRLIVGDKLALTPPMGWNSWYIHYDRVTDENMRQAADAMVESGMADFGYMYVNIDDGWPKKRQDEPYRDKDGAVLCNAKFPDMKAMTDYIHGKGLRAGTYISPGPWTCAGYVGSYQHEEMDARTFAEWGFDFLKYDWCSYSGIAKDNSLAELMKPYQVMGDILKGLDRDIVLNLCQYGMGEVWKWGGKVGGHCWRTTGDLGLSPGFMQIGRSNAQHYEYARPGQWNDPDYILIGWVGDAHTMGEGAPVKLSPNQQYQYMSMWSLMASPLFFSGDMTRLDDFTLNVLCNSEIIAVNQDPLGQQGKIVTETDDYFVLVKPLADGSVAAGLFNKLDLAFSVELRWQELGLKGPQSVRDCWRQRDLGTHDERFETMLPEYGVMVLRLSSSKQD
ncbi:MAG: NPCBM/NEW2 domain-containing protein [Planctomycetales bacterium]|nr:NPCBM/NEW2 domain-containing protein [Planctomycetales bacterium]